MEYHVLIVFLSAILAGLGKADFQEPRCFSYYDFQEKLLEKLLVITNRMDILEKSFAIKQQELNNQANQMKNDNSKMENEITNMEKKIENLVTTVNDQIVAEQIKQRESMAVMDRKVVELMTSSEAKIARLSTDVREYTNKSREELLELLKDTAKPNVAFLARTVSDTSPGNPTNLIFTTTLVNTDNCYSTETGEFTSPINGTYWFATQICGYPGKYVNFRIYVNDVMMSDTTQYGNDSNYDCTTANTVAILSMGDKVYVKTGPNTSSGNVISQSVYRWSMFMGTLVN